jgi:hypothetical protein
MSDCAIALDGTLKDAKEIQWFNDADDLVPIPSSRSLTTSSSVSSVTSLDDYFPSRPPAKKVGGERHSTHIRKPSKRTTDPDNIEATGSTVEDAASGQKRKVGISSSFCRVAHKVIESESGSDKSSDNNSEPPDGSDTEGNSDEEEDQTRANAKYDRLKSLGDEDREVLTLFW